MKAVFINGSSRKDWNTHKLLINAINGANQAGADTELYNLYDLNFTGCRSCFACKIKNAKTHGACAYPDDLKPVMKSVMDADVLVLGTPVYFGNMSAQMNCFWERLMFAVITYESDSKRGNKLDLPKEKRCAMIVTMGCPENMMSQIGYTQHFNAIGQRLGNTLGHESAEMLYCCDTYQFTDYSKYNISLDRADPLHKAEQKKVQFPVDMEKAYELGKNLC